MTGRISAVIVDSVVGGTNLIVVVNSGDAVVVKTCREVVKVSSSGVEVVPSGTVVSTPGIVTLMLDVVVVSGGKVGNIPVEVVSNPCVVVAVD